MAIDPVIHVEHLRVSFGELQVLKDINFTIGKGEVFIILGGSGCGKSTLMRHMVGLRKPQGGKISVLGNDIVVADSFTKNEILSDVGVMFQSGALFGSMTLLENVRLPLEEKTQLPMSIMNTLSRYKLDLVGLGDFCDYLPSQISGGMQKRAAIARAMSLDPRVLFLDEPSAGLDPITSASIDDLILRLAKELGITIIVVSHELASIFAIADRVIMLQDGYVIAEGDPRVLRDQSDNEFVQQFFQRKVKAMDEK